MNRITYAFLLIASLGSPSFAWASQADCKDYTDATGEDRALFNGFIYGYVSAQLKGASPTEINATTMKVRRETDKYCVLQPADNPNNVVALFAEAEAHDRRRR